MKKITAIVFLWAMAGSAMACDICGCSMGGNYFGILPQFQRHFVGLRYQHKSFETQHPPLFTDEVTTNSVEEYHNTELWGRFIPHRRLQLFASVPLGYHTKKETGRTTSVQGLGDVMLMANLVLLNTGENTEATWKHAFQVGGGVKLPSGAFQEQQEGALINPKLQLGTGSVDFPLNLIYTLRYQRAGINTELNYRVNTTNRLGYRFGNRSNASARLFYWQQVQRFAFLPQAGLTWEHATADQDGTHLDDLSGGHAILLSAGNDIYLGPVSVGLHVQQPLRQQVAQGYIKSGTRLTAQAIFMF